MRRPSVAQGCIWLMETMHGAEDMALRKQKQSITVQPSEGPFPSGFSSYFLKPLVTTISTGSK